MKKHIIIYKLIDPITNEIRYVGITTKTLKQRLNGHINQGQKKAKKTKVQAWVRKLLNKKLRPIIEIIEEFDTILECHLGGCSFGKAGEREIYWIDYYKKEGCNLTNLTSGGDGSVRKWNYESYINKCKKVDQYTRGGKFIKTWLTISEAARFFGKLGQNGSIVACCKGVSSHITVFGYVWRYNGESFDSNLHGKKVKLSKTLSINQYDIKGNFIKTWGHSQQIEDSLNICRVGIALTCRTPFNHFGRLRKPIKEYYFLYKDDLENQQKLMNFINNLALSVSCKITGCRNIVRNNHLCYKHHCYNSNKPNQN